MKITKFRLWKNCGFVEDSVNVPKIGEGLPSPFFTSETGVTLKCERENIFSSITTKQVAFDEAFLCSYIEVTYQLADGSEMIMYGWIDKVTMDSDSPKESIVINFHIDYWRTYIGMAICENGIVTRRVGNGTEPPQNYSYKNKHVTSVTELIPILNNLMWVYFTYTFQSTGTITYTRLYCFPVDIVNIKNNIHIEDDTPISPSLYNVIEGGWDEALGIAPTQIKGVWMSHISPISYTGTGVLGDAIRMSNEGANSQWIVGKLNDESINTVFISKNSQNTPFENYVGSIPTTSTNDVITNVITDCEGSILTTLPWGINVNTYTYRMVISTISAYIQIRFNGINSNAEGISVTVPCISIETTDNSWSDYIISGQRQYDIDSRNKQNEMALTNGIAQSSTNAAWGGMIQGKSGAGMGAGGSIISSIATYAMSQYYAPQLQKLEDTNHALQLDSLLLPGSGFDFIKYGRTISLVKLSWDDYSIQRRLNDLTLNGWSVNEANSYCQDLVQAGGPLQIQNLTVSGNIPNVAKTYIKNRLMQGVRII